MANFGEQKDGIHFARLEVVLWGHLIGEPVLLNYEKLASD